MRIHSTLVCCFLLSAFQFVANSLFAQSVTIQCSDSLLPLARAWVKAWSAQRPADSLDLKNGPTDAAFQALARKQIQIAIVPRSMRYKETSACEQAVGARPAEFKLAVNALAIYIHPNNRLKEISYDDLFAVFTGKYRDWKDLGLDPAPISAYAPPTNSCSSELFLEEVLNGKPFAQGVRIMPLTDLLATVAKDQNGIAIAALAPHSSLRAAPIKRAWSSTPVEPSSDTITNRVYPITRFIYAYGYETATQTKPFLEWLRSDQAQLLATQVGFYPLAPKWRPKP